MSFVVVVIMQYVGNRAQTARGMEVRSVVGLRGKGIHFETL